MARADSGGFDLGLHLALDACCDQINAALNAVKPQVPADSTFGIPLLHTIIDPLLHTLADRFVTIHTDFTVDDITVRPGPTGSPVITLSCSTTGTWVTWPTANYGLSNEEVTGVEQRLFACTLSIAATPTTIETATGATLVGVTFPDNAVTVAIDEGTLEQISQIQAWLAHIDLITAPLELMDWVGDLFGAGLDWLERCRAKLYDEFHRRIAGTVTAVLDKLPDAFVPLGLIPSAFADLTFDCANDHELRVLVTMAGGRTGSAGEITRSPIRRTSQGTAEDIAAVIVGNHYLLRQVVKPILQLGLGLSDEGFDDGHPCHWWGATQLMPETAKVQDMVPSITTVHGGIDAGMITVTMDFGATHATGAYGLTGSMRVEFSAPDIQSGGPTGRILKLKAPVCVITGIDIWIAWWAYIVPALIAPVAALILLVHDAIAGAALRGTITKAIGDVLDPTKFDPTKVTLELPLPKGMIPPPPPSLSQVGPKHTWIAQRYPGLPPGSRIPVVDPEPENDAILRFS